MDPTEYDDSLAPDPVPVPDTPEADLPRNSVQFAATPPIRHDTTGSYNVGDHEDWMEAGPSDLHRRYTNVIREIANFDQRFHLKLHNEEEEEAIDEDERRFINPSLLSHLAVQLRDSVPRGIQVKGSIPYPRAFTGKDIVVCPHQKCISYFRELIVYTVNTLLHHHEGHSIRTRRTHYRSASGIVSCAKPTDHAVLLRSGVGSTGPSRWCRGRLHVYG